MAPKKNIGSIQAYPFVLQPGCSDGKPWSDEEVQRSSTVHTPFKVPLDDDIYKHWKLTLGALLRDQLLPKDNRNFYLEEFPEHYSLWKKSKKADPKGGEYLLYGMDGDKPRAFRSPRDFLPHLLWLISGRGGKHLNCSCDYCGEKLPLPVGTADVTPAPSTATSATPAATTSTAMKRSLSNSSTTAKVSAVSKQASQAIAAKRKVTPVSAPVANQAQAQSALAQQPSRPRSDESVLFREGEVVWFKNNAAWRLGIVLKAVPADPSSSTPTKCLIQPIAHAYIKIDTVLKVEADIRPFLAFSVPTVNMKEMQGLRFQQVPWNQIQASFGQDKHKQELIGLEASKMAVTEMDHSFSTFNHILETQPRPGIHRVGGVFLGAEKIRVGEAVRVQVTEQEVDLNLTRGLPVVMVIRDMVLNDGGQIFFFGELYRLEETANPQPTPNQIQLPPAMLREKAFRDQVKKSAGTRFDWILFQQNVTKPEKMIRGRFYETAKLMAILDPVRFKQALDKGVVEDVQAYLNNRLASTGARTGGRKNNRLDMLAGAVPADFRLTFGPGVMEAS